MAKVDLKVVLLGKEFSGKTSLVERFLNERFAGENRYQNTIGAAYGAKEVQVGEGKNAKRVILGIWDTAGSERYESMSRMYYRGASAAILCYAVNDSESWDRLTFWLQELKKFEENCRLYICATKLDLVASSSKLRAVDYHNTTDLAEEVGAKLFETSSKSGEGIKELFQAVAEDFMESIREERNSREASPLGKWEPDGKGKETRTGCCR